MCADTAVQDHAGRADSPSYAGLIWTGEFGGLIRDCCQESLDSEVQGGPEKKSAPVVYGGQVALVLSRCESLIGGLPAGEPMARKSASEGGAERPYGRSAPFKEAAFWGDAESWAAKLFSITRTSTLLVRTRLEPVLVSLAVVDTALPRATACMR